MVTFPKILCLRQKSERDLEQVYDDVDDEDEDDDDDDDFDDDNVDSGDYDDDKGNNNNLEISPALLACSTGAELRGAHSTWSS